MSNKNVFVDKGFQKMTINLTRHLEHKQMTDVCQGTVFTTKKKCTKLAISNSLCGRHKEQIFVLEANKKGETVCRQFPRGCRNYLTDDDKVSNIVTCKSCRESLSGKAKPCEHTGCPFKTEGDNRFCGKHVRDPYREAEATTAIRYCNIDRGCASVLIEGEKQCDICINAIRSKIQKQLSDLRKSEVKCLKCRTETKTCEYFCSTCLPSITFVVYQSKREINDIWHDIYNGAVRRNNLILLPYKLFTETVIQPCYYCGKFSETGFMGIDRYDNSKGYIVSNIKPCCTVCNISKIDMPVEAFLDKLKCIVKFQETGEPISSKVFRIWYSLFRTKDAMTYNCYKYKAEKVRHIPFLLTETQYKILLENPCYLCGKDTSYEHKNGIDRTDSTKPYIYDNCKSCCTHCNLMKKTMNFIDFVNHCKSIVKYFKEETTDSLAEVKPVNVLLEVETEAKSEAEDGDKDKEDKTSVSVLRMKKTIELYHSADIYQFIQENTLDIFCQWAKEAGKTAQFIQGIRDITSANMDKSLAIQEIQRQMELERTRTYKERQESHVAKHYSASSVHAMLLNGESSKFKAWYEIIYGISNSFTEQLAKLVSSIKTVASTEGIELCRKFLKAETARRKSIQKTSMKHTMKATDKRTEWVAKVISTPPIKKPVTLVPGPVLQNIFEQPIEETEETKQAEPVSPLISKLDPPKQWKAQAIYNAITGSQGDVYKKHCEVHNILEDKAQWEVTWSQLTGSIKKSGSFEKAKDCIKKFIIDLRKTRHKKFLDDKKPDVLERDDRKVWPKESVLKAFRDGKIDKFKEFNVSNGETGATWEKRWSKLITDLGSIKEEKVQLESITKFQVNVRTARYRKQVKK